MEKQYLDLMRHVLNNGHRREDRTGVGTRSIFGAQIRCDLSQGFPLLTTKRVHLKSVIHELLWMLSGSTNVKDLHKHDVTIWDEWANEKGELGPVYGKQWRRWGEWFDQISDVEKSIKNNPYSRRHIVSAWNVGELHKMALPPCHMMFQFYVADGRLSCQLYQRSGDLFLGVPFNIASYALLTMMFAKSCDLEPGEFIHTFGDVHIYNNHVEQCELQLSREIRTPPTMVIAEHSSVIGYKYEDFELRDYNPHPTIKAEVAV